MSQFDKLYTSREKLVKTVMDLTENVNRISGEVNTKQDTLVSGESIKTVNGESLLGSGGLAISGETLVVDETPTSGSDNLVKSGGVKEELALGSVYDVSAHNDGTTFASLSALLSSSSLSSLIPTAVRKGGMSIKFVQSSDNNYVQYRYMPSDAATAATFTNVANWQGVDAEPTAGSENLVKSGGVEKYLAKEKTENASPNYAQYAMLTSGSLGTNAQYGHYAPITLEAGATIYLNMGNAIYHGYLASCLYETDSNGTFVRNLISGSGTKKESYTNTSGSTMYVGVSAYTNELGYIIEHVTKAPSLSSTILGWIISESFLVDGATYTDCEINSPISVVWPDGSGGSLALTRNSDGDVTAIAAVYGEDTYSYSITRDSDGNVTDTIIVKQ